MKIVLSIIFAFLFQNIVSAQAYWNYDKIFDNNDNRDIKYSWETDKGFEGYFGFLGGMSSDYLIGNISSYLKNGIGLVGLECEVWWNNNYPCFSLVAEHSLYKVAKNCTFKDDTYLKDDFISFDNCYLLSGYRFRISKAFHIYPMLGITLNQITKEGQVGDSSLSFTYGIGIMQRFHKSATLKFLLKLLVTNPNITNYLSGIDIKLMATLNWAEWLGNEID
jgi:hypothetical protein